MFQSRNRGSFDFKEAISNIVDGNQYSFNLVIEVLLISSNDGLRASVKLMGEFQSRNRGSFDFKGNVTLSITRVGAEKFQSRNRGSFDFKKYGFQTYATIALLEFQSRNRGSFDFK